LKRKKEFKNTFTASTKEVCEMFKKEGFNCYHLSELAFRKYKIKNKKQREGIINIRPGIPTKTKVFGHEVITHRRLFNRVFDVMASSSIGVVSGNNCSLSFFDSLSCGLPVLFHSKTSVGPEYLFTNDNHCFYNDEKSFNEGVKKLSKVNRNKLIDDFVENNKKEINRWKKIFKLENKNIRLVECDKNNE
jgi:hypothetical protein